MDALDAFAEAIIDKVLTSHPRIRGVSAWAYAIPAASITILVIRNALLGILQDRVPLLLISYAGFLLSIAWVGKGLASLLYTRENRERVIDYHVRKAVADTVGEDYDPSAESWKAYLIAIGIVTVLATLWISGKGIDPDFRLVMEALRRDEAVGMITLALDSVATALFLFFWVIVAFGLARVILPYIKGTSHIHKLLEDEVRSVEVYRNLETRMEELISRVKNGSLRPYAAVLRFISMRYRLRFVSIRLLPVIKKLFIISAMIAIAPSTSEAVVLGGLKYTTLSGLLITIGLLIPSTMALYAAYLLNNDLKVMENAVLRNKLLRSEIIGDAASKTLINAWLDIGNRIGSQVIPRREVIELLTAATSISFSIIINSLIH